MGKNDLEGNSERSSTAIASGPRAHCPRRQYCPLILRMWDYLLSFNWPGCPSLPMASGARLPPMAQCVEPVPVEKRQSHYHSGSWKAKHRTKKNYCWALRSNGICLAMFWTCLGPVSSFIFQMSPSGISILCLSHHFILEACTFSGFTGSQL